MKSNFLIKKPAILFAFCTLLLLIGSATATATSVIPSEEVDIDWLQLIMGLFGGLALFLFGLEFLSEGLKKVAGEALRSILARLTINRFTGALTGVMISGLYEAVCRAVALAVQAVGKNDQRAAESVLLMKSEIADLAMRLFERQARRLPAEDPDYLNKIRLQMSLVEQLRRIYTLSKSIARTNLPPEVAMEPA